MVLGNEACAWMLAPLLPLRSPDPVKVASPPGTRENGRLPSAHYLLKAADAKCAKMLSPPFDKRGALSCLTLPAVPFTLLTSLSPSRLRGASV